METTKEEGCPRTIKPATNSIRREIIQYADYVIYSIQMTANSYRSIHSDIVMTTNSYYVVDLHDNFIHEKFELKSLSFIRRWLLTSS